MSGGWGSDLGAPSRIIRCADPRPRQCREDHRPLPRLGGVRCSAHIVVSLSRRARASAQSAAAGLSAVQRHGASTARSLRTGTRFAELTTSNSSPTPSAPTARLSRAHPKEPTCLRSASTMTKPQRHPRALALEGEDGCSILISGCWPTCSAMGGRLPVKVATGTKLGFLAKRNTPSHSRGGAGARGRRRRDGRAERRRCQRLMRSTLCVARLPQG